MRVFANLSSDEGASDGYWCGRDEKLVVVPPGSRFYGGWDEGYVSVEAGTYRKVYSGSDRETEIWCLIEGKQSP